jgi:hypothetical protein
MFYEKPLLKAGVYSGEVDECMAWAFGNEWRAANRSALKDLWNKSHTDLLVISAEDDVFDTLIKVGLLYVEYESKTPFNPELLKTEQLISILETRMEAEIIFIKGSAKARKRRG